MSKEVIIHLDNDQKGILDPSKNLFDQYELGIEYITCKNKEEFSKALSENRNEIRALIFDLLSKEPASGELQKKDAQFLVDVKTGFANFNIPIFIYSGYLPALEDEFDKYGTVFKVDKGEGIEKVFEKFILLYKSGFIDVFCPKGILETEINEELHNSFINQFSESSQIEEVIKSILNTEIKEEKKPKRIKEVFKRIAIKALSSDLLAPLVDGDDKVNPIEHFYKRQSKLDVWTGDIWKKIGVEPEENILVLTPRCDFATGKAETIIVCSVLEAPKIELKGKGEKKEKILRNYLTDNKLGKAIRYIPSNVFFPKGGEANLSQHFTFSKKEFLGKYEYVITLGDEFTNEIVGKFAYYFLRTGITNIDEKEFESVLQSLNPEDDKK